MKTWKIALASLFLLGCAGMQRDCSSCNASSFGGDWVIVQYQMNGTPINCWKLRNTPVENEAHTDGVYWQDPGGHLVHISGWYNRVQVQGERWEEAAKTLGVNEALCRGGVYHLPFDGGP